MVSPSFAQEYSIRGASSSIFSRIWDEMDIIYRFIWWNGSESDPFSTEKECISCANVRFLGHALPLCRSLYCLLSAAARRQKPMTSPHSVKAARRASAWLGRLKTCILTAVCWRWMCLLRRATRAIQPATTFSAIMQTSRKPTTLVRKVLFRLAFTAKLIFGQIRFQKRVPSSVQGNAKAVKPCADSVGCSHPKKPRKSARFIWIAASWKRPDSWRAKKSMF